MAIKVMTANSTIVFDEKRGEYRQFFEGDEFDTNDPDVAHLMGKLGDHLFAEKDSEEAEVIDLHAMKVQQLLEICNELGVEPKSSRKQDLINAIQAADAIENAEERE